MASLILYYPILAFVKSNVCCILVRALGAALTRVDAEQLDLVSSVPALENYKEFIFIDVAV
jgi:hypothetical protein